MGGMGTSFLLWQCQGSHALGSARQAVLVVHSSAQSPAPSPWARPRYHSSNYHQLNTLST